MQVTFSNYPVIYQTNSYSDPMVTGAVQWNGQSRRLEVSNGTTWVPLNTTMNMQTNPEVVQVLEWAKKKIAEERELEALAKENPAINDLVNQIKEKRSQIDMVKTLIKKETQEWHEGMTTVAMQAP